MLNFRRRMMIIMAAPGGGQGYDENGNPQDKMSGGMALTGIENKYLYPSITGDAVTGGMNITTMIIEAI